MKRLCMSSPCTFLQVVVLPYMSFILEKANGTSIPSARGRPARWRAAIKLAVHNMLPVDLPVSSRPMCTNSSS